MGNYSVIAVVNNYLGFYHLNNDNLVKIPPEWGLRRVDVHSPTPKEAVFLGAIPPQLS
jgi:alkyl sulfatase BDS1-like metallo-beta-lactamase superfamily hydrolase